MSPLAVKKRKGRWLGQKERGGEEGREGREGEMVELTNVHLLQNDIALVVSLF